MSSGFLAAAGGAAAAADDDADDAVVCAANGAMRELNVVLSLVLLCVPVETRRTCIKNGRNGANEP